MQISHYPDYLDILEDLKNYFKYCDVSQTIWQRENEPDPLAINLSFHPQISETIFENYADKTVCTLCARRIGYKPGQFTKNKSTLPYLILLHNSFILSSESYFEDSSENNLFKKMIQSVFEKDPSEFLVREIIKCYFGQKDEFDQTNIQNCIKHIEADILKYKIKGILVIGQASKFLAQILNKPLNSLINKKISFLNIATMICPGPNRIVFMHKNNYSKEKIEEEKNIIKQILLNFKSQIIDINN